MINCSIVHALVGALFVVAANASFAQPYPSKPVRVIVPAQAGGGADIVARAIGQRLSETWGQQVVVDNRTGAGSIIGTDLAAKATPDGYTVMLTTSALAVGDAVYKKLPYNTLRDFQAVTEVVAQSNVLVVNPNVPVRSVKELVALAKARPGQLNYGSAGVGTSNHLAGELLKLLAGIDVVHVPYKGIPQAVTDLLGGHLHFQFGSPVSVLPHVKAGRLRLLAVTTPYRSSGLPDVPTVAEAGVPGYEFTGWMGVLAPTGTPPNIVRKLYQEIVKIVRLPDLKQRFAADGADTVGSTPEEFAAYLKAEIVRWTKVAEKAGIRQD